jgi:hypothetical protein
MLTTQGKTMNCVDKKQTQYITEATSTDDLIERMREVMQDINGRCVFDMAYVSGLSTVALYNFKAKRGSNPKIETLNAMLKFLAPGHQVGLIRAA